jgi:ATP-dependent Clp protease adapter protein ClpS
MGLNGSTTNGRLMVRLIDVESPRVALQRPPSPVFPTDTSLLDLPEFVPPGFVQGIEVLNDEITPMEFVTDVLRAHAGLDAEAATEKMQEIHTRGGALIPAASLEEAQRIASAIGADAASQGHRLVCRAVSVSAEKHGR